MDGTGRALDNVFTERLWRTVKYEEVYIHSYGSPREARHGLNRYLDLPLSSAGPPAPAESCAGHDDAGTGSASPSCRHSTVG